MCLRFAKILLSKQHESFFLKDGLETRSEVNVNRNKTSKTKALFGMLLLRERMRCVSFLVRHPPDFYTTVLYPVTFQT